MRARIVIVMLGMSLVGPGTALADATLFLPNAQQSHRDTDEPIVPVITVARLNCLREYVQLTNSSRQVIELKGWVLKSARDGRGTQTFLLPAYSLEPGRSVYVDSGPFAVTPATNRFRWTTRHMWNDDGDRAELYSPEGTLVDWEACWQS